MAISLKGLSLGIYIRLIYKIEECDYNHPFEKGRPSYRCSKKKKGLRHHVADLKKNNDEKQSMSMQI